MKLKHILPITGTIRLMSGLHIGASKDSIEIGGLDQPVIKHPITGAPYIPGSSLKGKMRSLLEVYYFTDNPDTKGFVSKGKPCGCGKASCNACRIFGAHSDKTEDTLGPTRLIVRDAMLCSDDEQRFNDGNLPMEVKYENIINRVKGVAEHPRPLERVPAGVRFDMYLAVRVFENDSEELLNYVYKGLKLVELDALGGCGSRGSGQVRFEDICCDGQKIDLNSVQL